MKTLEQFGFKFETETTDKNIAVISLLTLSKLKTIPLACKVSNEQFLEKWLNSLDFTKHYKKRLASIYKKEKAVHEFVKDKEIKGVRVCNYKEKDGKEWVELVRFELVYIDGTVIKIPEIMYYLHDVKLDVKYSNV